ncbi:hypothetical protein ACRB68_46490 [Actinomadura sp. RB68]|uniref:Uncharacterized protein n=1 Tax=Actinomadura macrotermitis TaxID=2585200 RepID=A0A7K0BZE7_9ACTN|nr:hypothetical protein [Actinomadura macrotermitis]
MRSFSTIVTVTGTFMTMAVVLNEVFGSLFA